MLAKQGERRIKKVIKGIHLLQFAQHIHLLFWAKDHFHLNKRSDSLISRQLFETLCGYKVHTTKYTIPKRLFYTLFCFSLFDHTWAFFRSHYAWHLLMLVIICTKCRKNPLTTVTHSFNKFVANLISSTTRVSRNSKAFKKCSFICCNRYSVKQVFYC